MGSNIEKKPLTNLQNYKTKNLKKSIKSDEVRRAITKWGAIEKGYQKLFHILMVAIIFSSTVWKQKLTT